MTGIDPCTDNISAARRHAQEDEELVGLTYICTSLEEHSLTMTNKYDAVVASEVIEHVDCPELFLQKCSQVTRQSGSIFLTTENKTFLREGSILFYTATGARGP